MTRLPNIVIFLTDQQHADTINGTLPCATPRLDRFAEHAVRFERAICPSPICTPSRASIQTGLYPHQHKLVHNTHRNYHLVGDLDPALPTLAAGLTEQGYITGYVGKWHVGRERGPKDTGYQHVGQTAPGPRLDLDALQHVVHIDSPGKRGVVSAAVPMPVEYSEPMRVADAAVNLMDQLAGGDQPFLLFVSLLSPHVPWLCPESYADRFDPEALQRPASFDEPLDDQPAGRRRHYNHHNDCRMHGRWDDTARAMTHYLGLCELVDDAFGRVLDGLGRHGVDEQTAVVFASDHGEMMGRHGIVGKGEYLFDDVVRVPLVIRPPGGLARTRVSNAHVNLVDLMATCLDWAGAAPELAPSTSQSLCPLLTPDAGADAARDHSFSEHHGSLFFNCLRCVRTEQHKYIFNPHERDELFDLSDDPHERRNRIDDPALHETRAALVHRLLEWMERTDDQAATGARLVLERELAAAEPSTNPAESVVRV